MLDAHISLVYANCMNRENKTKPGGTSATTAHMGKGAKVAFSFLYKSNEGWTVQALGSEALFGGACCGATFSNLFSAVCFLRKHGFDPLPTGAWARA